MHHEIVAGARVDWALQTALRSFAALAAMLGVLSVPAGSAHAQTFTYSETMAQGVSYVNGTPQADNWLAFRASLPTGGVRDIAISGSNDPVGRTCSDPALAQQIADGLRAGMNFSIACDGFTWNSGDCAAGPPARELNVGPGPINCQCNNLHYVVRPRIGNSNWGGIGGATCNAFTQTLSVVVNADPIAEVATLDPREKTLRAIQRFLKRRNDLLLSNGPDMGRQIDRLAGSSAANNNPGAGFASGGSGTSGATSIGAAAGSAVGGTPLSALGGPAAATSADARTASLTGTNGSGHLDRFGQSERTSGFLPLGFQSGGITDNGGSFSFATSITDIARNAAESKRRKLAGGQENLMALGLDGVALVQPNSYALDLWVQGTYASYDQGSSGNSSDGDFGVLYIGMDYVLSPAILVGALLQYDQMEEYSADLGTRTEGQGWMAGPYVTVRATENVFMQARAAWGKSDNDISPFLTYTDTFDTERWLVEGSIQGRWSYGQWSFNPKGSIAYIEEDQEGYRDSLGFDIASQTVTLGQARFGPRVGYLMTASDGTQLEPYVGIEGIWNFEESGTNLVAGTLASREDFRGRVDAGLRLMSVNGLGLDLNASYDGIGADDYDAYSGEARLRIPLR